MSARLRAQANGFSKILALEAQRLDPINVRNSDLTKSIGDPGVRMDIRPFVVDLQHLSRVGVIINDHSCIANDGYSSNFTRMEPTDMNMCCHAIRKSKIKVGNIVNV